MYLSNEKIKSGLLGFLIGLAVIIPGFSGAQIAIMFSLYDKLMDAMSNLFKKRSIIFLIPIVLGAILGFILGLFSVRFLLKISTFAVVAFFAGLMIGGFQSITNEVKGAYFKKKYIINLIIGLIIPLGLSITAIHANWNLSSLLNDIPWYMYLFCIVIGVLVALTQLIPGLSATALLMSFGLYNALMDSISITKWQENPQLLLVYASLVLGALLGIILISKIINKMLNEHKIGFYYIIIGLCLSSFMAMFYNPEIVSFYDNFTSSSIIHVVVGIILFIIGAFSVLYASYKTNKEETKDIDDEGIKYNAK